MAHYPHNVVKRGNWILAAAYEDKGPYAISDRYFVHAEWRVPEVQRVSHPELDDGNDHHGIPYSRRKTWIPIYKRARAALDLVDEGATPSAAKKAVDWAGKKLGQSASVDEIFYLAQTRL